MEHPFLKFCWITHQNLEKKFAFFRHFDSSPVPLVTTLFIIRAHLYDSSKEDRKFLILNYVDITKLTIYEIVSKFQKENLRDVSKINFSENSSWLQQIDSYKCRRVKTSRPLQVREIENFLKILLLGNQRDEIKIYLFWIIYDSLIMSSFSFIILLWACTAISIPNTMHCTQSFSLTEITLFHISRDRLGTQMKFYNILFYHTYGL